MVGSAVNVKQLVEDAINGKNKVFIFVDDDRPMCHPLMSYLGNFFGFGTSEAGSIKVPVADVCLVLGIDRQFLTRLYQFYRLGEIYAVYTDQSKKVPIWKDRRQVVTDIFPFPIKWVSNNTRGIMVCLGTFSPRDKKLSGGELDRQIALGEEAKAAFYKRCGL